MRTSAYALDEIGAGECHHADGDHVGDAVFDVRGADGDVGAGTVPDGTG
ncbi:MULTISPECIES: hypothetical protein [unclassified Streptomyces]